MTLLGKLRNSNFPRHKYEHLAVSLKDAFSAANEYPSELLEGVSPQGGIALRRPSEGMLYRPLPQPWPAKEL